MDVQVEKPKIDLNRILKGQLPALPQSAMRLLEISKDPENGPEEYSVPIELDPGLASQVLRFVNSSYFGFSQEISTVKMAITMVGVKTIENFVLWSAVFSLVPSPQCGPLDLKTLWQDSLRRALFARSLGKTLGLIDCEEVFSAALLQDMAMPVLAQELTKEYEELLTDRSDRTCRLSLLEYEYFGWSHAEAGHLIAKCWKFPEETARLIACHADPATLRQPGTVDPGATAIAMSALLPAGVDNVWIEREAFMATYDNLGASALPSVDSILTEIDQEYADFAPLMKMTLPDVTLGEHLEKYRQA